MVERAEQLLQLAAEPAWYAEALEGGTVNVICAPDVRLRVDRWVAAQPMPRRALYLVRTSVFVQPGAAYVWQLDGILAPRRPHPLRLS